eukprot:3997014-Prymnesium_polylepis.3
MSTPSSSITPAAMRAILRHGAHSKRRTGRVRRARSAFPTSVRTRFATLLSGLMSLQRSTRS